MLYYFFIFFNTLYTLASFYPEGWNPRISCTLWPFFTPEARIFVLYTLASYYPEGLDFLLPRGVKLRSTEITFHKFTIVILTEQLDILVQLLLQLIHYRLVAISSVDSCSVDCLPSLFRL